MVTPLSRSELDAFAHTLIRQRIRALIDGDLTGRRLQAAREILAFTILGHARHFPDCPAAAVPLRRCPWPAPLASERVG